MIFSRMRKRENNKLYMRGDNEREKFMQPDTIYHYEKTIRNEMT